MTEAPVETEELPPSRLGTKAHWDSVYEREVSVFQETGDEGEVWFGENSVKKMVQWAVKNIPSNQAHPPRILECGCGNGTLLLAFLKPPRPHRPYPASSLTGIDYSEASITLAREVERARKTQPSESDGSDDEAADSDALDDSTADWRTADLLQHDFQGETWDLVLDKGTYDALALSDEVVEGDGRLPSIVYPERLGKLVAVGGFFLITSCNFTEEEIKVRYGKAELGLEYHSSVAHPSFAFGGKVGTRVCTVAFRKV